MSQQPKPLIDKELLDACIHCGLCLPACPTYLATGREMESPRGRIYLLSLWASGQEELTPRLSEHIDSCLGCFGCQTACPSGVDYESILNQARPHIAAKQAGPTRNLMRYIFKKVLPDYKKLRQLGALLKFWQRLNLGGTLRGFAGADDTEKTKFRQLIAKLSQWDALTPLIPEFKPLPKKSWRAGKKLGTVQLFSGCVMDVFYNHVNHSAVRLLKCQGNIVEVPEQTCCGALAYHAGEADIARDLAKKNIELLERSGGDIAVTAAGCGSMLKEYGHLFKDDPQWSERAKKVAGRIKDITEALAANDFPARPTEKVARHTVAYHAACHLAHAQKVRQAPEKLLVDAQSMVSAGDPDRLKLVPLKEAEHCCGSAGIYNLLHTEISLKVLERKMACIAACGADLIVTTNPGCQLQLEAGARSRNMKIEVKHLCQFLDEIYSREDE